jgi:S-adenosylmethionine synthetase
MAHTLFTSETVSRGHPDKIADQISDAIVDACLEQDINSKVACECMISKGVVFLGGEITTFATLNYRKIIQKVLAEIGYQDPSLGFDFHDFELVVSINEQSSDIARGVNEGVGLYKKQGAGDQGMMFGYACNETTEFMPVPIIIAQRIMQAIEKARYQKKIAYLRPDAKCQVTVEFNELFEAIGIHTIVISTQHDENIEHSQIVKDMKNIVNDVVPEHMLHEKTLYFINPTGRFVIGGPVADCGLTGRKIIVDTYGGMARHGGGAFSGKDPSKVDRSGAYAARYVAKNIVAAGLARRCEVQLAYAIGVAEPVSIKVSTKGTASVDEALLVEVIPQVFSLSPSAIIEMLDLKRPIYYNTSYGGHFGRTGKPFTWEKIDKVNELKALVEKKIKDPLEV